MSSPQIICIDFSSDEDTNAPTSSAPTSSAPTSNALLIDQSKYDKVDMDFLNAINKAIGNGKRNSVNKCKRIQWDANDTREFFMALRQCSGNFQQMSTEFFNGESNSNLNTDGNAVSHSNGTNNFKYRRSVGQLRDKCNQERKKNVHLVQLALNPNYSIPQHKKEKKSRKKKSKTIKSYKQTDAIDSSSRNCNFQHRPSHMNTNHTNTNNTSNNTASEPLPFGSNKNNSRVELQNERDNINGSRSKRENPIRKYHGFIDSVTKETFCSIDATNSSTSSQSTGAGAEPKAEKDFSQSRSNSCAFWYNDLHKIYNEQVRREENSLPPLIFVEIQVDERNYNEHVRLLGCDEGTFILNKSKNKAMGKKFKGQGNVGSNSNGNDNDKTSEGISHEDHTYHECEEDKSATLISFIIGKLGEYQWKDKNSGGKGDGVNNSQRQNKTGASISVSVDSLNTKATATAPATAPATALATATTALPKGINTCTGEGLKAAAKSNEHQHKSIEKDLQELHQNQQRGIVHNDSNSKAKSDTTKKKIRGKAKHSPVQNTKENDKKPSPNNLSSTIFKTSKPPPSSSSSSRIGTAVPVKKKQSSSAACSSDIIDLCTSDDDNDDGDNDHDNKNHTCNNNNNNNGEVSKKTKDSTRTITKNNAENSPKKANTKSNIKRRRKRTNPPCSNDVPNTIECNNNQNDTNINEEVIVNSNPARNTKSKANSTTAITEMPLSDHVCPTQKMSNESNLHSTTALHTAGGTTPESKSANSRSKHQSKAPSIDANIGAESIHKNQEKQHSIDDLVNCAISVRHEETIEVTNTNTNIEKTTKDCSSKNNDRSSSSSNNNNNNNNNSSASNVGSACEDNNVKGSGSTSSKGNGSNNIDGNVMDRSLVASTSLSSLVSKSSTSTTAKATAKVTTKHTAITEKEEMSGAKNYQQTDGAEKLDTDQKKETVEIGEGMPHSKLDELKSEDKNLNGEELPLGASRKKNKNDEDDEEEEKVDSNIIGDVVPLWLMDNDGEENEEEDLDVIFDSENDCFFDAQMTLHTSVDESKRNEEEDFASCNSDNIVVTNGEHIHKAENGAVSRGNTVPERSIDLKAPDKGEEGNSVSDNPSSLTENEKDQPSRGKKRKIDPSIDGPNKKKKKRINITSSSPLSKDATRLEQAQSIIAKNECQTIELSSIQPSYSEKSNQASSTTVAAQENTHAQIEITAENNQTENSGSIHFDIENNIINPKQHICWSCGMSLSHTNFPNAETTGEIDEGQTLATAFFIHEHPLLGVSSCATCADLAYGIEDDVQEIITIRNNDLDSPRNNIVDESEASYFDEKTLEMEVCSWCGYDGCDSKRTFFLCDDCPRIFCERCVIVANGGGPQGKNITKQLQSDKEHWSCVHCQPPPTLSEMKKWMSDSIHDGDDDDDDDSTDQSILNLYCSDEDDDHDNETQVNKETSIYSLISDLFLAEDEREKADEMLEDESKKYYYEEIKKEIEEENPGEDIDDEKLRNEFDSWEKMWNDQYHRSVDAIGILQDLLDQKGIDVKKIYQEREDGRTNQMSKELEERVAASLDKRDLELGQRNYYFGASGREEVDDRDLEDLDIIELKQITDINTTEGAIARLSEIAKRKNRKNLVDQFKIKALPTDNEILEDLGMVFKKRKKFTEVEDEDLETKSDRRNVSYKGASPGGCRIVTRGTNNIHRKSKNRQKMNRVARRNSTFSRSSERSTKTNAPSMKRQRRTSCSMSSPTMMRDSKGFGLLSGRSIFACFEDDTCILATIPKALKKSKEDRRISVAAPLAKILKPHQKEGIKFMWDKALSDIIPGGGGDNAYKNDTPNDGTALKGGITVKGCILAHNMGLGKTLQVITLIHTLLTNPHLQENGKRVVTRILIVVPVNTLANWESEFCKWIKENELPKFRYHNLNKIAKHLRSGMVENWFQKGGVLYCSLETFARTAKNDLFKEWLQSPGPDLVILDEAHLMLKNNETGISKTLFAMRSSRRIALTGTPFQNNLLEYYRMTDWIRPGCLAISESEFERKYEKRIMSSLMSDSSKSKQKEGEQLLKEVYKKLAPYVQRLDSTVLQKDLKFMQQAVIHVRQTKIQLKLYQAYKRYAKQNGIRFLEQYQKLFPVNNHPGCLLFQKQKQKNEEAANSKKILSIDDDDSSFEDNSSNVQGAANGSNEPLWWEKVYNTHKNMGDIANGNKIIILMQILVLADMMNDKVVVFSQSLYTLDFIEKVLQEPDWSQLIPSIAKLSPGKTWGKWKKNIDYLRIDGSISAKGRGNLIRQFHEEEVIEEEDISFIQSKAKVFLISSKAGNVGINLVGANRVIIFDSHWNPTVDLQALYRCYRYGQKKPVFAYRLITEGTMEEKVYSRSVNKTSLAARVLDQKHPARNFSKRELEDIMKICKWVQCDRCDKWRMLPPTTDVAELPDKWYCYMNVDDKPRAVCSAKEMNEKFYHKLFYSQEGTTSGQSSNNDQDDIDRGINIESTAGAEVKEDDVDKVQYTKRDGVLQKVLALSETSSSKTTVEHKIKLETCSSTSVERKIKSETGSSKTSQDRRHKSVALISRYYFHESLLK